MDAAGKIRESLSVVSDSGFNFSIRKWFLKGFWTITDQALFSGANFLVNIFLARWLPPKEYGAFAVALSIFYLLAGFHTAVLTEPMMVFGAGKYREHFRKYLGMLLYGHWGVSLLIALGLGIAAFVMKRSGSPEMAQALAGLAVASPFMLFLWLTRRACYVPMRPTWAVAGSGLNLLLVLTGVFLLWRERLLTSFSGLVLLGVTAGMTSFFIASTKLRPRMRGLAGNPTAGMVIRDHWGYGTWNLLAFVAYWSSGQILMLLIPVFLGLAASAAVAAVWNLYRPVGLFMQSLGLVLLPTFSRWVSEGMVPAEIRRRALRLAVLFGGAVLIYSTPLTAGARQILHLLYAGKYDKYQLLVGLFGLSTSASISAGVFLSLLKARRKVGKVALAWTISSIIAVVMGVPLMLLGGLVGALITFTFSYLVALVCAYKLVKLES